MEDEPQVVSHHCQPQPGLWRAFYQEIEEGWNQEGLACSPEPSGLSSCNTCVAQATQTCPVSAQESRHSTGVAQDSTAEMQQFLQDLGLDDDDLAQEQGKEGASKSRMADLFGSSDEE